MVDGCRLRDHKYHCIKMFNHILRYVIGAKAAAAMQWQWQESLCLKTAEWRSSLFMPYRLLFDCC